MAKKKLKEEYIRDKVNCNVGTIGHVDHGKTTLTAALTHASSSLKTTNTAYKSYEEIDSTPEERARKITINAAHIEYETALRHYSHIDCPGHQDYIKNMIVGAFQMEGVILVVSLVSGVQIQTREHVILAKEIGIPYLLVYLNKLDLIDSDFDVVELIELEVRELLENYNFNPDCPFSIGSAKVSLEQAPENSTSMGLESVLELLNHLDNYVQFPSRSLDEPFLMSIQSALTVQGRGTVVTGKVLKGSVSVNEELVMLGKNVFKTTCLGLEIYRKSLNKAVVGDNIGILLRGIKHNVVKKNYVIAAPNSYKASKNFKARAYILSFNEGGRKKPFTSSFSPQFFFRTSGITGKIMYNVEDQSESSEDFTGLIMPGDTVIFKVELLEAIVLEEGLRFVIREGKLTIGRGIILEIF